MRIANVRVDWIITACFALSLGMGCAEDEKKPTKTVANSVPILAEPNVTLEEDNMAQLTWVLPDETWTQTEIQRQFADGDDWLEWENVGRTANADATYMDGPVEAGVIKYRIRCLKGDVYTDWAVGQTIEVPCLKGCEETSLDNKPAETMSDDDDPAEQRPMTMSDDEDEADEPPALTGDESGPLEGASDDADPTYDILGADESEDVNNLDDRPVPDEAVESESEEPNSGNDSMPAPAALTADEIQDALTELRQRFQQIQDESVELGERVEAQTEVIIAAADPLGERADLLMQRANLMVNDARRMRDNLRRLIQRPRVPRSQFDRSLQRFEAMNSAFEALLTEIEGRPDGLDMQDVRRNLNGLRGQIQQVKIKLATLANEYTTLRDEAAASELAGFIDDATHSEFEGEFDLDDGAHQRLDNELDGHLETVSTAASRARGDVRGAEFVSEWLPAHVEEIRALLDEARAILDALEARANEFGDIFR